MNRPLLLHAPRHPPSYRHRCPHPCRIYFRDPPALTPTLAKPHHHPLRNVRYQSRHSLFSSPRPLLRVHNTTSLLRPVIPITSNGIQTLPTHRHSIKTMTLEGTLG